MQTVSKKNTSFLKGLLRNLGLILLIGIVLFIIFPDLMRQVFGVFGGLFAPGLILVLIVIFALPRRRKR
jgi:hypothetical protein